LDVEDKEAMRLNKSTGDAIRILIACARANGALVKVVDLSATLDITMQNVFKIVHILSRSGLTAAVRGRHGGVRLSRPADQIFIGDIVRAMEQTETASEAGARSGDGSSTAGDVTRVLDDALEAFIAVLDRHSLADMVAREGQAPQASTTAKVAKSKSRLAAKPRDKSSRRALRASTAGGVRSSARSARAPRTLPPKQ
jgi:Rrf2 family transcriptional regulator, nitric oxide-sensitive transcriptional repressor